MLFIFLYVPLSISSFYIIFYFKSFNPIYQHKIIKLSSLYWILFTSCFYSYLFIYLWSFIEFSIIELINININSISWLMVLIVLFVSSSVIIISIDYLSIMDSSLFLVYIILFQFSMITFILTNDLLIIF